jgi:FMN reductase
VAEQPFIVGLGGTTRAESTTEIAVRLALRACEQRGARTKHWTGAELEKLPFYAPERPERTAGAERLIADLREADGVIIGSSSYHGSVAGLMKNALDYTQDMMKDDRPYFAGRPVGCIATGAGWQGVVATLEHLRTIVHSLRGWPTPLGSAINTLEKAFTPEGEPIDEKVAFQLNTIADEVLTFIERWRS